MSTEIILSDKAFLGVLLSSIEVYKNECMGILLGYKTRGRIVVEYAIPLQSAKRRPSEVESNWRREAKVIDVLPKLVQFEKLGYYHSHPQWGSLKGVAKLSDADIESMNEGEIELIVAINDSSRSSWWKEDGKRIKGTIGQYRLEIAGYYLCSSDSRVKMYRLVCPYAVGFDQAFIE
jgi:proteasome lid subunit RPN8/RPN11